MRKEKIIVADRYMTLKSVKPKKDCNVCDYINDYVCFDHEHQQIKKVYPNCEYNDDCEWVINDQFKFLLLSHGFIFNDSINNNNITRGLNDNNKM